MNEQALLDSLHFRRPMFEGAGAGLNSSIVLANSNLMILLSYYFLKLFSYAPS